MDRVWVREVKRKVDFKVTAGHEKKGNYIIIDPSQTPSGKLARVPLGCLHIREYRPDGVSVPLSESKLYDEDLVEWLRGLTPESVLKKARSFSRNLWSYR